MCVIQHFYHHPRLSSALNAYDINASFGGLCARTHTNTPFPAVAVVSRSELVELSAATCGGTWLDHGLKITEPSNIARFIFLRSTHVLPTETQNSTR